MSSCTPSAFIGEFDALDGPKITYAFEYFGFHHDSGELQLIQLISFISGKALIGEQVASGLLHPDYGEYMRSIAARVLTSHESQTESVIFQESDSPAVGGLSFTLHDILARGEKRRFCVVVVHPYHSMLIARWPLLFSCIQILLDRWYAITVERHTREYATFADLERLREDARCKPLRSLMTLLSGTDGGEQAVLHDTHCFFESALPLAFSRPAGAAHHLIRNWTTLEEATTMVMTQQMLNDGALFADSRVEEVNLGHDPDEGSSVAVLKYGKHLLLPDREIIVKPLSVWLLEWAWETGMRDCDTIHTLLFALFSGNQIIVSGEDAYDCANLALALSYVLPLPLRKLCVFSEEYQMPYRCQILSFSKTFLDHRGTAEEGNPRFLNKDYQVVFSGVETYGAVNAVVCDGKLREVRDDANTRQEGACDSGEAVRSGSRITTLSTRVLALLQATVEQEGGHATIPALQLLTAQLDQLVCEYVLRGRVYTTLFRQQEIDNNQTLLGLSNGPSSPKLLSKLRWLLIRGSPSSVSTPPTAQRFTSPPEDEEEEGPNRAQATPLLYKGTTLGQATNRSFRRGRYIFCSSSTLDHDVLMFLGGSRCT